MAGAEEVMQLVERRPGTTYTGLVLNEKGYDRALATGVDAVNYGFPVTETFARRNQNTTVADGIATGHRLVERARADGLPITVTLIVSFGCPFEGPVAPTHVLDVAGRVLEAPPDELVVADTIGVGVPRQVRELISGLAELGVKRPGAHFHNTRNTGIANAMAALEAGATVLDASVGGEGCSQTVRQIRVENVDVIGECAVVLHVAEELGPVLTRRGRALDLVERQ